MKREVVPVSGDAGPPEKPAAEPQVRKDGESWIAAALELMAQEGIDGVRVELLARRLGVTKGSFYWHFKDRAALHAAILDHWRRQATLEVFDRLADEGPPQARYASFMRASPSMGGCSQEALDVELAIRLWARRDERARAALEEIDELRIRYIAKLMADCGAPPGEARVRAMLAYAYKRAEGGLRDDGAKAQCEAFLLRP